MFDQNTAAPPPPPSQAGAPSTDHVKEVLSVPLGAPTLGDETLPAQNMLGAALSSTNAPPPVKKEWTPEEFKDATISAYDILSKSGVSMGTGGYRGENFYGANIIKFRRIPPFKKRLGLENQPENYMMMPGAVYRWEPAFNGRHYRTGLEDKDELRAKLEKATGFDLRPDSEFYANLSFKLEDKRDGFIMNLTDSQIGLYLQIVLFAMIESPLIASSYAEYYDGRKPAAEWYIEDKEKEANAKERDQEFERQAFELYTNMSPERRAKVARVLGLDVMGLSDKAASAELWDYIKGLAKAKKNSTDPATASDPKTNVQNFMRVVKIDNDSLEAMSLLTEAMSLSIIRRNTKREIEYKSVPLGMTEDLASRALMRPDNQLMYSNLQKEVEAKKRMK